MTPERAESIKQPQPMSQLPDGTESRHEARITIFENRAVNEKRIGAPLAWYETADDAAPPQRVPFDSHGIDNRSGVWMYESDSVSYHDITTIAKMIEHTDAGDHAILSEIDAIGQRSDERLRRVGIPTDYTGVVVIDVESFPIHSGVFSGHANRLMEEHKISPNVFDVWGTSLHKALIDAARRVWPFATVCGYGHVERVHINDKKDQRKTAEAEMLQYTGVAPMICYVGGWDEAKQASIVRQSEAHIDDLARLAGIDAVRRFVMLWPERDQASRYRPIEPPMVAATLDACRDGTDVAIMLAHKIGRQQWVREISGAAPAGMRADDVIREIFSQCDPGPSTWSKCQTCGNGARSGRRCVDCLETDLAKLCGPMLARSLRRSVETTSALRAEIEERQ